MNKNLLTSPGKILAGCIALTMLGGLMSQAHAQVYDRFNGRTISLNKWQAPNLRGDPQALDLSVSGGRLHMRVRRIGDKADGTEGTSRAISRLRMPADRVVNLDGSPKIRVLQSVVTVRRVGVRGCNLASADTTKAQYIQYASWFNDGRSSDPDDLTGSVFAGLAVVQDETRTDRRELQVVADLGLCNDSQCTDVIDLLATGSPVIEPVIGTVRVGERVSLRTSWNKDKGQIRYTAKAVGGPVFNLTVDHNPLVNNGGNMPQPQFANSIRTQAITGNCDFTQPDVKRPVADIDVDVDYVSIKPFN